MAVQAGIIVIGRISNFQTCSKKPDSIKQELLFTKAVKLTLEDVEFVKDMAIAVKSEGNFSEGIRACIKATRKQYGDDVKELAARRKSFEAVDI